MEMPKERIAPRFCSDLTHGSTMRLESSLELFNYWNSTRGDADAPLRSQIDPGAMRHILPKIFILEAGHDGDPRFRLAGTTICSLFGRELRDTAFSSLWTGRRAEEAADVAVDVMDRVAPALVDATGHPPSGRPSTFEVVLLPMRSSPDRCDRLLGCLVSAKTNGHHASQPLSSLRLDRIRLLDGRTGLPDIEVTGRQAASPDWFAKGIGFSLAVRRALHL